MTIPAQPNEPGDAPDLAARTASAAAPTATTAGPLPTTRKVPAPLPLLKGMPLGAVPETVYEEDEVRLAADDTLLMYTDGLIERRHRSVGESLTQLLVQARTVPPSLDQQLDRLLTHSRSDTDDDTCIVGIRLH